MSTETVKPAADSKNLGPRAPRLAHALSALHNDVNQLFGRFLSGSPFEATAGASHASWLDYGFANPAIDVTEGETAFRAAIELPGVAPDDVDLSIAGNTLVLKGEKREDAEENDKTVHIFERSYGAFQRSIHIPDNIDRASIAAKFDKGVLVITLPKVARAAPQATKIAIKVD